MADAQSAADNQPAYDPDRVISVAELADIYQPQVVNVNNPAHQIPNFLHYKELLWNHISECQLPPT